MTLRPRLALAAALSALSAPLFAAEPAPVEKDRYFEDGQSTLAARRAVKANKKLARNVILFVADGMDPTTVAAARIYDGQTRGEEGEENFLSFERFPHLAMAKTYNTDAQTPDSAGTMSAMTTGVKTKIGVVALSDAVRTGDCESAKTAFVSTLGELSERAGLATGVVSTSLITDATPAAVYAHAADRSWQTDAALPPEAVEGGCKDIARQLIEFSDGDGLEVVLGGGRAPFLPAETLDPEYEDAKGARRDGRNLTEEWTKKGNNRPYVWNREGFNALDPATSPKALGLFEPTVMKYETDRETDAAGEPSLVEMTRKAIEILRTDKDGFLLVVEGGRVDHAHHAGNAARALKDAQIFAEAVAAADEMTSDKDTLIIVTADHGHTMTFAGYPRKGNDILGLVTATPESENQRDGYALAGDGKTYTTLGYAMGPGAILLGQQKTGERHEPTREEVADVNYKQQSTIPNRSETHGGQDVTIYAKGPRAYLFGGVVEQNYVFHVIDDALRLRKRADDGK
ncbi:MAG: alkaline phosphatase [Parvularculaceae bacterium]|nr:alkaline phosphatase [Parvularculaceae bacterium]